MAFNYGAVGGVTNLSTPQARLRANLARRWPGTGLTGGSNPNPGLAALADNPGANALQGGINPIFLRRYTNPGEPMPPASAPDFTQRYTDPNNYLGNGYSRGRGGPSFEGDTAGGGLGQHYKIEGYSGSGVPTSKPDGTGSTADDYYAHRAFLDWQAAHPQGAGQAAPAKPNAPAPPTAPSNAPDPDNPDFGPDDVNAMNRANNSYSQGMSAQRQLAARQKVQGDSEQDAANQEEKSEVDTENQLGDADLPHLFRGGSVGGNVKAVVGDDPNNPWAEPEVVSSKSPIHVINHAQALLDYGPGLNEPGAPPHFFEGGTATAHEVWGAAPQDPANMEDEDNDVWEPSQADADAHALAFSTQGNDWDDDDQKAVDDTSHAFNDDNAAQAFLESDIPEPSSASVPPNPYRLSPAVPATALNRWQRAAVNANNDFYANNPDAVQQRGAEAQQAQLASEGISTLNSPTGPVRIMRNRYGSGIFAAGGLPAGTPHYVGDEKGAVNTNALDAQLPDLHYQQDPLAGTDWGTFSGIAPKPMSDAELAAAITGASSQALADFPEYDADEGKLPVPQQMANWWEDHPPQTFNDADGGETAGPAPFSGPSDPTWRQTFGMNPSTAPTDPYARSSALPGLTGDPTMDRRTQQYYRMHPEVLAQHAMEIQKMDHETDQWIARDASKDNRGFAHDDARMAQVNAREDAISARSEAKLNAQYGDKAAQKIAELRNAQLIGKGMVEAGEITPAHWQSIQGMSDGAMLAKELKDTQTNYYKEAGKSQLPQIHNVSVASATDKFAKPLEVPHYVKVDAQGNPYLVRVPVGAPATAPPSGFPSVPTRNPQNLFPRKGS